MPTLSRSTELELWEQGRFRDAAIAASSLVPKGQEARSFWALNTASRTLASCGARGIWD